MCWEKPSCKSNVWVCFLFKASLCSSERVVQTEMVWKRHKCDSTTHAQWKNTWMGLKSTLLKEDGRKQIICCIFFHFFWLSFKNEQSMNLTKQFSNSWKLSYIPMTIRKVISNIAQVLTMDFSKNSTPKFSLDIKNNGFILPRHDKKKVHW